MARRRATELTQQRTSDLIESLGTSRAAYLLNTTPERLENWSEGTGFTSIGNARRVALVHRNLDNFERLAKANARSTRTDTREHRTKLNEQRVSQGMKQLIDYGGRRGMSRSRREQMSALVVAFGLPGSGPDSIYVQR